MSAVMKLKTLQGHLQELKGFTEPKIHLEQYETPAHIAAVALYTIQTQFEGLENKLVLDAGCGPGALAAGAALLGAGAVTALEVDADALSVLRENVAELELTNVDAVQCDFANANFCGWENCFDTVVMNPPFGTKNNAGIDIKFLRTGLYLASDSVYSLHKTATRPHIRKKMKEWAVEGGVVAELRYDLPPTYRFHRRRSVDVSVDLWRLHHPHS